MTDWNRGDTSEDFLESQRDAWRRTSILIIILLISLCWGWSFVRHLLSHWLYSVSFLFWTTYFLFSYFSWQATIERFLLSVFLSYLTLNNLWSMKTHHFLRFLGFYFLVPNKGTRTKQESVFPMRGKLRGKEKREGEL